MPIYGIDASSANKNERTGVEEYSYHVIEALKKIPLFDHEKIILYSKDALNTNLSQLPSGWSSKNLNWKISHGYRSICFSRELKRNPPDLLFVPGQALPYFLPKHSITTIHDIAFRRHPELYTPDQFRRLSNATNRAVKKASKIFVVSEFSRREIQAVYGVAHERIEVTANAVCPSYFSNLVQEQIAQVLDRYRLGRHFFLFVGRLEKKKNPELIIRAFDHFKMSQGYGDPFELVLAGLAGYGYGDIKEAINNCSQKESIRELGYIPRTDLNILLKAATASLFPSRYEGFGIPILESMAAGTPVLCSEIGSLKEVGGDAIMALEFNPFIWAQAMKQIVDNNDLRLELIEKGSLRVTKYSWQNTAENILRSFRSLCESSSMN